MTEQTRVFRTERIWLKQTVQLRKLCHISKNLFNEANYLVRQVFFNGKKWIRLSQLHQELSSSANFQQLPAPTARKILQLVEKTWKSFFAASIDWKSHPEKYFQQPRSTPLNISNCLFNNYSHNLKKNFIDRSEV
ncbi:MAG: hypothetical protein ACFFFH_14605 [Candidatus Thorarchaeota archaeon]